MSEAHVLLLRPVDELTPYEKAQRLGWQKYRHSGFLYLPELVIAGALRDGTRTPDGKVRARYDDRHPNLRRHVILLGDRDFRKGSIVDLWRFDLMRTVNYADPKANPHDGLLLAEAQGGSTWESGRGGSANGRLVLPTYYPLDILYVSECLSWLGHDPKTMMKTVEQLNSALQEGRLVVDLTKMKGMSDKELRNFSAACEANGIMFNPAKGVMYYEPDFLFIACTREPPSKIWADMKISGFVSRLAPVDLDLDEETLDTYLRNQDGPGDPRCLEDLRAFFDYLRGCRIAHLDNPGGLAKQVVAIVQDEYRHLAEAVGRSRRDFRLGREAQYISQLLTFSALSRLISQRMRYNQPPGLIDHLDYSQADVEFAVSHMQRYIFPIVQKWAEKSARGDNKVDTAYEEAIQLLGMFAKSIQPVFKDPRSPEDIAEGIPMDPRDIPSMDPRQTFPSGDFYRFYIQHKKVSWTTYHERMALLKQRTAISQCGNKGRERIYRISDATMESFGLKSARQLLAELEAEHAAGTDEPQPIETE